jgi:hypothetical protein
MVFGVIGVTEGQLLVMGIMTLSAVMGEHFWAEEAIAGVPNRMWIVYIGSFGAIKAILDSTWSVIRYCTTQKDAPSLSEAFGRALPFVVLCLGGAAWLASPYSNIIHLAPREPLLVLGFSFAHLVSNLVINHVTHSPCGFCVFCLFCHKKDFHDGTLRCFPCLWLLPMHGQVIGHPTASRWFLKRSGRSANWRLFWSFI